MDINGTVESTELEFTVELDTGDLWDEIEDQVNEAAYDQGREAARDEIQNADFDIDYGQGAEDLLNSYAPGTGCNLARLFEEAVRGAVSVDDWLTGQIGEHQQASLPASGLDADAVREIVRTEIRHALADASSGVRERQLAAPTA